MEKTCNHETIGLNSECTECGMLVKTICNNVFVSDNTETSVGSILKDMEALNFPAEIKKKADDIYKRIKKVECSTHRGKKRKKLIAFCIYNAYKEINSSETGETYSFDPKYITKSLGLKFSDLTKASSMFSEVQTGYKTVAIKSTPKEYIKIFGEKLGFFEDTINSILSLYDEILLKDKSLLEDYPNKVASGIILYFITINGLKYTKKDMAEYTSLTEVTIGSMFNKISLIHNS